MISEILLLIPTAQFELQEDLSVVGIRKQKDAPAPLSPAEEEAKMSQLSDAMRLVGVETKG